MHLHLNYSDRNEIWHTFKFEAARDGLAYRVLVVIGMLAEQDRHGGKLKCVLVTSDNQTITSTEEREIQILCK